MNVTNTVTIHETVYAIAVLTILHSCLILFSNCLLWASFVFKYLFDTICLCKHEYQEKEIVFFYW